MEGTSAYKLLYHELISEFLHKLLNLTQDIVLSLKQVLNLLESPVPETFRCPSPYCIPLDSFSSFNESQKHILSFHLRSSFQTHLTRSLSQLREDESELGELLDHFADLRRKLPAALREGPEAVGLDDPAYLASMIDDVEQLLLVHLLSEGDDR